MAPDLVGYSKAQQKKAAQEMKSGACPALNGFMTGYSLNRDQIRALRK